LYNPIKFNGKRRRKMYTYFVSYTLPRIFLGFIKTGYIFKSWIFEVEGGANDRLGINKLISIIAKKEEVNHKDVVILCMLSLPMEIKNGI
jgi:hypothetical protein